MYGARKPAAAAPLPPACCCACRLVGPCVLGGLRPRLLLITTPNWEYNAVLRAAERLAAQRAAAPKAAPPTAGNGGRGGSGAGRSLAALPPGSEWPGPPGRDGLPLRCADHRFEWTRAEFRSWARGLAAEWGYDVRCGCPCAAVTGRGPMCGWIRAVIAGWSKGTTAKAAGCAVRRHRASRSLATLLRSSSLPLKMSTCV